MNFNGVIFKQMYRKHGHFNMWYMQKFIKEVFFFFQLSTRKG